MEVKGPTKDITTVDVPFSFGECVQFASITPLVFKKDFSIMFRLKLLTLTSKKAPSKLPCCVRK